MARKKVENALKSERQVNDALLQIGTLEIELERIEADMNDEINAAKKRAAELSADLVDRATVLRAQLKLYAEEKYMDGEFDVQRKEKYQFGEISYHRSQKVAMVSGVKVAQAIEFLEANGHTDCIRIKKELDKDAIRAKRLSTEVLKTLGLRMQKADTFGYKVYREKILSPADAGMEESTEAGAA